MVPLSKKGVKKIVPKTVYRIMAPSAFGHNEIGYALASNPDSVLRRSMWTTLYNLTGDPSQQHVKLLFQVVGVEGDLAYTVFKGHDMTRDYLRSLIRRGSSKVEAIIDVGTKDGSELRLTILVVTLKRTQTSQENAIRKVAINIASQGAQQLGFNEFVQEMILGKVASDIFNAVKKIYPPRRVEVRKSKVLKLSLNNLPPLSMKL